MRKCWMMALVLLPALAMGLTAAAEPTVDAVDGAGLPGLGFDAPGDIVFNLDVGTPCADFQLLGVEFVDGEFYITGGNSATDPNKLYVVDTVGVLQNTYDQPAACTGWGMRDLAYDGTYLYGGCDDGKVHQIDLTGVEQSSFTGPVSPPRALAYDPETQHLWTASYNSDIFEIDLTGAVVNTYTGHGLAGIYGMAWDDVSEGGPWLWIFSQDTLDLISQFDPSTGTLTGTTYGPLNLGQAGGATFIANWVGPTDEVKGVLMCLDQIEPQDKVIGVEIFSCDGCYIEGVCYADQDPNPDNACEICDAATSATEWTPQEGESCDDGLWCTENDACDATGACTGTERDCDDGEFCTGAESCDEDNEECVSAGDPCDETEVCNEDLDSCDDDDDDDAVDDDDDDDDDDSGCCG